MAVKDTVLIPKVIFGNVSPPASYATGGFLLDLSASFTNLGAVRLSVETVGLISPHHLEIRYNVDATGAQAFGMCVIKIVRHMYDKATIGAVSGLPSGVTGQSILFAAGTTAGSSHTHSITHDHPAMTIGPAINAAGTGVDAAVGGDATATHTHTTDPPVFTGNSATGTHAHNRTTQYDHQHGLTEASTDVTQTEVDAATNLSTTVFRYMAVGLGDQ